MKKTIILAAILAVSCLSACELGDVDDDDKNEEGSGEVSSVTLNGLNSFYMPTDIIEWDNVYLTVTLLGKSTLTLTKGEFDVESPTSDETEFILNTSGLYTNSINENLIPEGDYAISYYFVYNEVEYSGDLFSVAITEYPSTLYSVYYFLDPDFVTTYKANLDRVDDSEDASEDAYYEACEYTVGDDNPFLFKPILALMDHSFTLSIPDSYAVDVSLYLEPDDESDTRANVIDDSEYVSYSNFSFQFTEEAIGHTFTIEMSPKYFTYDISYNPIEPVTFTFNVEDGYNAYTGLDLDMINVAPSERIEGWSYYIHDIVYSNEYSRHSIYYDPDYTITPNHPEWYHNGPYLRFPYIYVWNEFFTNEHPEMDAHYIKGIYMHNDISISLDDFPADFKISEEEAADTESGTESHRDLSGTEVVGSLRAETYLYNHFMADDFTFNGNLFTLDASNIRWCRSYISGGDDDTPIFLDDNEDFVEQSSSRLFCFSGRAVASDDYRTESDEEGETARLINLNTKGNLDLSGTGVNFPRPEEETKESTDSRRAGCITFCDSESTHTLVNNVIVKEFLHGLYAGHANECYTCLEINHSKVFDCYISGVYSFYGGITRISNSVFKRFGAPAMMAVSGNAESYHEGFEMSAFILDNVIIENTLQGDEYFFESYGITQLVPFIEEFDSFFSGGDISWVKDILTEFDLSSILGDFASSFDISGILSSASYSSTDYGRTFVTSYTGTSGEESSALNVLYSGMDRNITGASASTELYLDYQTHGGDFLIDYRNLELEGNLAPIIEEFYEYDMLSLEGFLPLFVTNTGKIFTLGLNANVFGGTITSYLYDVKDALNDDTDTDKSMVGIDASFLYSYGGGHDLNDTEGGLTEEDTDLMLYYRYGKMCIAIVLELYPSAL
ncbi:MAG: hypothetical protein LUB56_02490 [Coprobacillus sp.]|nr:hypothetical protein [Coprobacillus sp.]